jgi:hypothetical protein
MKTIALAAATTLAAAGCVLAMPTAALATPPACGNQSLAVIARPDDSGLGHGSFVLLFRNKTTHACTLFGYPGLDALNATGGVMKHARRTLNGYAGGTTHGLQTVRVAAGRFASATVEWHNFNFSTGGTCRFSHSVAATPPNTSHTVHRARSVSVCGLQVHPTVAGKSGSDR